MHFPFVYFFSLLSRFPWQEVLQLDLLSLLGGEMRRAGYFPVPGEGVLMSGVARELQSRTMMTTRSQRRRQRRSPSHRRRRPEAVLARALTTMLMMLLDPRPGRGPGRTDSPWNARQRCGFLLSFFLLVLFFLLVVRLPCTAAGRFLFPKLVHLKR